MFVLLVLLAVGFGPHIAGHSAPHWCAPMPAGSPPLAGFNCKAEAIDLPVVRGQNRVLAVHRFGVDFARFEGLMP